MMKIQKVKISKLMMPLSKPFITNIRTSTKLQSLIYQIVLEDGSKGYGESAENYKLTGESFKDMVEYSKNIVDMITGMDVRSALSILTNTNQYHSSKYGIEVAMVDAISQSEGKSIDKYLNIGEPMQYLQNDTTISVMNESDTRKATISTIRAGYKCIKYKVSRGTDELNRILNVKDLLGKGVSIRIDPNQAWSRQQAITYIDKLQNSDIKVDFIEQPVNANDLDGMREVKRFSHIPIVADESVFGLEDAEKIINGKYADLINIKLIKCGGPIEAIRIANFAKKRRIRCLFGCTSEVNISLSMAAYLSAGLSNVSFIDLDGLDYLSDTPFSGGMIPSLNGKIYLPKTTGLGININPNSKYLTTIFE
ncbi:mandelate racemase/muconate lactonizing enzyme family protein [Fructilactobacillus fructivorans]|uniref:mandelate racemase/muconate lactonizing enzyme family protein n=1 Tax=Fructilactobacillus fructivorans TaxID=1614 RepID=UPI0007053A2D|nr:enolase C-terminal domain-like protein [Fructilactobacillus fructivorans]KRN43081.1 Mandelate racemase muconate lactonizing protein [Fructilactobacillus fructivorans]